MKSSFFQISIVTILLFSSFSQVVLSRTKQGFVTQTNKYPLSYRAAFLSRCISSIVNDVKNQEEVYNYTKSCLCVLDKIQDKYTFPEYREMLETGKNQELKEFSGRSLYDCI